MGTDHQRDARRGAPDPTARWGAAGVSGASSDPAAVREAIVALGDVEARSREVGAGALAELATRGLVEVSAVGPLATALDDPSAEVRSAAAHALAELARRNTMSPQAIGPLVAALEDTLAPTRRWAVEALGHLGRLGPSARRTVWAALSNRGLADVDGEVRRLAAEALAALHDAPATTAPDRAAELGKVLCEVPVEEATDRLVELGRSLHGPALRRASWVLVARALSDVHAQGHVLRALASATTREHALRALRLARAARVNRPAKGRAGTGGGPGEAARQAHELSKRDPIEDAGYYHDGDWAYSYEPSVLEGAWPAGARVPGVLAVGRVQVAVDEATERASAGHEAVSFTALRARTDDATYARLMELVHGKSAPLADVSGLADRLGLGERAADFAKGSRPQIHTAPELGLVCLLEEERAQSMAAEIDWARVTRSLVATISAPPPADEVCLGAIVRAFLRAVTVAPRPHLVALLRASSFAHSEYSPIWLWAQLRAARDATAAAARVRAAFGSTLALHDVRVSLADIPRARAIQAPDGVSRPEEMLAELLLAGAGTLRRMDYPAFRLVVRPSISIVPAEMIEELTLLAQNLAWKNHLLATGTFDSIVTRLFEDAESTAHRRLPDAARRSLTTTLEEHAIAYVVLKTSVFADEPVKIRRKHVRALASRKGTLEERPPATFAELHARHGLDLAREGLCHALLGELHERWTDDVALAGALKEGLIGVLRSVATTYRSGGVDLAIDVEDPAARALRLSRCLQAHLLDAPFELAVALGVGGGQGLPRLAGGRLPDVEQRFGRLMRRMSGALRTVSGAAERVLDCRPLSKVEAIGRSRLGSDCSSRYVPFRALSPHHVYYGLFEGGEQKPGYITVYEAWAELPGAARVPVLCLETVNVPSDPPDSALLDLVRIFESIAAARGLHPGLVLITGIGTWNYASGPLLQQSRRFRRGTPVALHPADPVTWRLYEAVAPEARSYSAFEGAPGGAFRLLAPFDPDLDMVQPENEDEAARLRSSDERELLVTARSADGPVGFISGWPDVP